CERGVARVQVHRIRRGPHLRGSREAGGGARMSRMQRLSAAAWLLLFAGGAFAQDRQAPRKASADPDLEGFWTHASFTPLERAPELGDRAFYTAEEAEEIIQSGIERGFEQTEPGTVGDVHYDFSQFGLTRGQDGHVENLRTSLIVDPA